MELELIKPALAHALLWKRWRDQKDSRLYNPQDELSLGQLRTQLQSQEHEINQWFCAQSLRWFVRAENTIVGTVTLKNINTVMLTAELGYLIGKNFQNRGFGTQAVEQVLQLTFSRTKIRRVMAFVHEKNGASISLLNKLGFLKEGVLREHYLIQNKPVNEFLFAILKKDWLSRESPH